MAEDRCICCGAVIPEGRQVCPKCESMTVEDALKSIVEDGIELGAGDYVDLDALKVARKALEKQIAKKQGNINDYDSHLRLSKAGFLCCCATNKNIRYPLISLEDLDYCPRCGQKLDWSEV